MNQQRSVHSLCVAARAATLLFTAFASAQAFGPWTLGVVRYVAPAATGLGNGLNPANAMDLPTAMGFARTTIAGGTAVTLELSVGLYPATSQTGPARGLRVDSHFRPMGNGRPIVQGLSTGTLFDIDNNGPVNLPPSEFRSLEIRNAGVGIQLEPWRTLVPTGTSAVVIRNCLFRENTVAILESATAAFPALNLVDGCEFMENGTGIFIRQAPGQTQGASSTLIRANSFDRNFTGISVTGTPGAFDRRPRILSNQMQRGRAHIVATDCSPVLVNNTLAFVDALGLMGNFIAFTYTAPPPEIAIAANNNFWNPNGATFTAADVSFGTSVVAFSFNNSTTAPLPGVGNISFNPVFRAPNDLHLDPTSPLIEMGNNGFVVPPLLMNAGTLTNLPADVGIDMDGSPRLADRLLPGQTVDIGADEVPRDRESVLFDRRLVIDVANSVNVDVDGNVSGAMTGTMKVDVHCAQAATGPLVAVFLWRTFASDPNLFNVPIDPFGNALIDMVTPGSSFLVGSGLATAGLFTVSLPVSLPSGIPEGADFRLQAVEWDLPTLTTGEFTNVLQCNVSQ